MRHSASMSWLYCFYVTNETQFISPAEVTDSGVVVLPVILSLFVNKCHCLGAGYMAHALDALLH